MQSDRKFRREPTPKMAAHKFAIQWSNNVEDPKKAISYAQKYEAASKEMANIKTDKLDKKHYTNTADFWRNVQGILLKYQKELREGKK